MSPVTRQPGEQWGQRVIPVESEETPSVMQLGERGPVVLDPPRDPRSTPRHALPLDLGFVTATPAVIRVATITNDSPRIPRVDVATLSAPHFPRGNRKERRAQAAKRRRA